MFSKPVLKRDEVDMDKAMADLFSEIGTGDDLFGAPGEAPATLAEGDVEPVAPEALAEPAAPAADPAPVAEPAPAAETAAAALQQVANDGNFMAQFLAMQSGAPTQAAPPEVPAVVEEEAPVVPKAKRSLKEIQEARKAARKRDADSEPPPPSEKTPPLPKDNAPPVPPLDAPAAKKAKVIAAPPAASASSASLADGFQLWPGEVREDEEDAKKNAKKDKESWEYIKKDDFGVANFFSFDSF